jgi:hypothetical protein
MIWIGVIIFLIGASISIVASKCDPRVVVGTILVSAGTIIFILEDHPTTMDVYRGKTTFEITYKDSIPVDSIVVFKNKKHD